MVELSDIIDSSNVACRVDVASKKKALHQLALILSYAVNHPGERYEDAADSKASVEASAATEHQEATGDNSNDDLLSEMDILDALISRERLGSTALGQGIAVPHGRIAELERPVAAMITLATGIEFDAPDEEPVDIVFALLVPEDSTDEHLKILSAMAEKFSNENVTGTLRNCSHDDEVKAHQTICESPEAPDAGD